MVVEDDIHYHRGLVVGDDIHYHRGWVVEVVVEASMVGFTPIDPLPLTGETDSKRRPCTLSSEAGWSWGLDGASAPS